nr:hypothetical protein [Tanacetum cinerariifolium]
MHIKKNVMEAILNTLLMNDKSKDTVKARQDLQRLGIRSGLWLGQTKNEKCLKPQAAYSFTPKNPKKFCQFIKGVKLPDGFGSCFKHKVIDNDTNIKGLKSHDYHIMMQRLLPYGLQNYLPDKIAKPIIELCSLFKQICSATLMEDDMLKAQIKVVNILCDLVLIYPPAFFDIMIHLVIHLPLEALEGGPIRPRLFPNKDMKEEFPDWFGLQTRQRHIDNDKDPEDDNDIIHFDNSSDLSLSTSLNDLDNATLHIDGQSTEVDVPPYIIIDVVDKDDDITDDENTLPHDLAEFNNEDLINVDDDGVDKMSTDVSRSHGGDGRGEDHPLHTMYPAVAWVALLTKAKANGSPIWAAGQRVNTRDKTRNLSSKEITDTKGPVRSSLRCVTNKPLCLSVTMQLIGLATSRRSLGTQFDLKPHMESPDWTEINAGIQQHLQKAYNTNKAAFKAHHWVIDPTTGTYNVEKIRRERPVNITASEWDKYIEFWNDPRNIARAAQNRQNQAKSTVLSRQGSRSLARLRDEMKRLSSKLEENPSPMH